MLTPGNHGHAAWLFLSSLGGGFVGADSLSLEIDVADAATCWLSSQASTKAYRASQSTFDMAARVEGSGSLYVWPDAVTCFAGASLKQSQRLSLNAQGSAMWVDIVSSGRVSRGERWAFEQFSSSLFVDVDGKPWLRESSVLSSLHGPLLERMAGLEAVATVVIVGPRHQALVERVAADIASRPAREAVLVAASAREGGIVIRVAAPALEPLNAALKLLLREAIAGALGDDPFSRKW